MVRHNCGGARRVAHISQMAAASDPNQPPGLGSKRSQRQSWALGLSVVSLRAPGLHRFAWLCGCKIGRRAPVASTPRGAERMILGERAEWASVGRRLALRGAPCALVGVDRPAIARCVGSGFAFVLDDPRGRTAGTVFTVQSVTPCLAGDYPDVFASYYFSQGDIPPLQPINVSTAPDGSWPAVRSRRPPSLARRMSTHRVRQLPMSRRSRSIPASSSTSPRRVRVTGWPRVTPPAC